MADISITITADPQQAIQAIDKVKQKTKELADESRKVAEADARATDAMSDVITVTSSANSALGTTITAAGNLGGEFRTAARAASSVSGALGESVPVIGRIGTAIQSVLTGPIGVITAIITAAVTAIKKMVEYAKDLQVAGQNAAVSTARTALEDLNRGREEYKQQLELLKQVRQLSAQARTTPLTQQETKQLTDMAGRLGIDAKYVSSSGVRSSAIDNAADRIERERVGTARAEYEDYLQKLDRAVTMAIQQSDLNDTAKSDLLERDIFGKFERLQAASRTGSGINTSEQSAYAKLFELIRPLEQVRETYAVDPLLGRTQAELDRAAAEDISGGMTDRQRRAEEIERDKAATAKRLEAMNQEIERGKAAAQKEAADKEAAVKRIIDGLENQAQIQELINADKKKEAFILQHRIAMEQAIGESLSAEQLATITETAGRLYDLRNPASAEDPSLVPPPNIPRRENAYTMPLDRLQRIGANVAHPVASAEKLTLDRQLAAQESIKNDVRMIATSQHTSNSNNTLYFP